MQVNSLKDKNDGILVEMSLLGDQTAYEELVIRHEKSVKGTAYKITENEFSAEDASQDAFVSAWIKLDSLREKEKFGSWVCSIAKNCARDLVIHYMSASGNISLNLLENTELASSDESGLADILNIVNISEQERNQKLHEAVEALSGKIRETVKLHYFEGLSVAEIAERQSLPTGTVKWRLNEGRRQLRKEYGVMENKENTTFVQKVMYQVEQLKLWSLKNDKTGFENDYRKVLQNVEKLDESIDKQHALADVLLRGYWWLPGEANDKVLAKIKQSAEHSHNEDVMEAVMHEERKNLSEKEEINFMLNIQLPYLQEYKFVKTCASIWFWLGYFYCKNNQKNNGIEAYKKVLDILDETDAYYANALSAIYVEEIKFDSKLPEKKKGIETTGEVYKYIDGKLYFWSQPGYSYGDLLSSSIFWNTALCDNLIFDNTLKVGQGITSSDKAINFCYKNNDITITTNFGEFNNCMCFVLQGERYGVNYVETYLCPRIGIVKQITEDWNGRREWQLSRYSIKGGNDVIPFAKGNRWEYTCVTDMDVIYNTENVFEVVSFQNDTAVLQHYTYSENVGYKDTWDGNILKARNEYVADDWKLRDVHDAMERAEVLAQTKREKVHTAIAKNVMSRILDTDPTINPNYIEKGRWNFFSVNYVKCTADTVKFYDSNRKYSFEWKNMSNHGDEGYKILYSFPYEHLDMWMGYVWSNEWIKDFKFNQQKRLYGKHIRIVAEVVNNEYVETSLKSYDNCIHISLNISGYERTGQGYLNGIKHYWLAQGIGIVKYSSNYKDNTLDAVWELTDYNGVGDGYFPVEDGFTRRYEPIGLGDGWHASVEYTFVKENEEFVAFRNALGTQDRVNYEANIEKTKP